MLTFTNSYFVEDKKVSFKSFSDPRYYFEKGKLCCKIVLDYHAKVENDKPEEESKFQDLISFDNSKDDEAIQALSGRDFNELLEEGLAALVEYLLNLFYRKQYYTDDNFTKMKERAFFWISITLFKLKRYEESLDLIKSYYKHWKHKESFIRNMVEEMLS